MTSRKQQEQQAMVSKLLFLCTGNSCRSQMAEGWTRHLHPNQFVVYSAGIETHGLNPLAVKVMQEVGVDISHHLSQQLNALPEQNFDLVITVCGHADEHCPRFPGSTRVIHHGFPDPPQLAAQTSSEQEALVFYRQVRDEIRLFVAQLPTYASTTPP